MRTPIMATTIVNGLKALGHGATLAYDISGGMVTVRIYNVEYREIFKDTDAPLDVKNEDELNTIAFNVARLIASAWIGKDSVVTHFETVHPELVL